MRVRVPWQCCWSDRIEMSHDQMNRRNVSAFPKVAKHFLQIQIFMILAGTTFTHWHFIYEGNLENCTR